MKGMLSCYVVFIGERIMHLIKLALLMTTLFSLSMQPAAQASTDLDIGRQYLDALYSTDLAELEKLLHADAIFEDPTAVAFGGEAWRITGRDAISRVLVLPILGNA